MPNYLNQYLNNPPVRPGGAGGAVLPQLSGLNSPTAPKPIAPAVVPPGGPVMTHQGPGTGLAPPASQPSPGGQLPNTIPIRNGLGQGGGLPAIPQIGAGVRPLRGANQIPWSQRPMVQQAIARFQAQYPEAQIPNFNTAQEAKAWVMQNYPQAFTGAGAAGTRAQVGGAPPAPAPVAGTTPVQGIAVGEPNPNTPVASGDARRMGSIDPRNGVNGVTAPRPGFPGSLDGTPRTPRGDRPGAGGSPAPGANPSLPGAPGVPGQAGPVTNPNVPGPNQPGANGSLPSLSNGPGQPPSGFSAYNLVSDYTNKLTNQDSAYMKNAEREGMNFAQQRGLLNSSIAGGAARKSALDAAGKMVDQMVSVQKQRESYASQDWLNSTQFDREFAGTMALLPIKSSFDMLNSLFEYAASDPAVYTPDVVNSMSNFFTQNMQNIMSNYYNAPGTPA